MGRDVQTDVDLRRVAPYFSTSPEAEAKTSVVGDIALGSIPGLGIPQALRDWRRSEQSEDRLDRVFGRAGAALATIPVLGKPAALGLNRAKRLKDWIGTYHMSHDPIPNPTHNPSKLLEGEGQATEGPGFYLTQHPAKSLVYMAQSANKNRERGQWPVAFSHRYALPRSEFDRFVKPWNLRGTHPETTMNLQRAFGGKRIPTMQADINDSGFEDSILALHEGSPQSKSDMTELLEKLRYYKIPGVQTRPGKDAYLVSHFPEKLRILGKPNAVDLSDPDKEDFLYGSNWLFDEKNLSAGLRMYKDVRKGRPLKVIRSYDPTAQFAQMDPNKLAAWLTGEK